MNVGVITYHLVPNFGAQLQALSTVGYLKRKGITPFILNWYPQDLQEMYANRVSVEQINLHNLFAEKYLPMTCYCSNEDELIETIRKHEIDALVLGSDALFKYMPFKLRRKFDWYKMKVVEKDISSDQTYEHNPFWGSFYPMLDRNIPICICSVSSQNSPYSKVGAGEYEKLSGLISNFSYVSVRDKWTCEMIRYFCPNKDVYESPDPVFSFNQNCFIDLPSKREILNKFGLPDKYVLLSFRLNKVKNKFVKDLAQELFLEGLTPVAFPMPEGLLDWGLRDKVKLPLDVLDWYCLIKYSSGYIGERMHPIVVAMHNSVPFYAYDEYGIVKTIIPKVLYSHKPTSSKIYHILQKADFLSNMESYYSGVHLTAKEVVDRIVTFNFDKMKTFSISFQAEYELNMERIIKAMKFV